MLKHSSLKHEYTQERTFPTLNFQISLPFKFYDMKLMSVSKPFNIVFYFFDQPERINPQDSGNGYDIKSDVWSLGITMVRLDLYMYASLSFWLLN